MRFSQWAIGWIGYVLVGGKPAVERPRPDFMGPADIDRLRKLGYSVVPANGKWRIWSDGHWIRPAWRCDGFATEQAAWFACYDDYPIVTNRY